MKERPLPQACATQESRSNQVRQTVRRWIGPTSILCSRRMSSAVKCTGPESVQIRIGGAWVLCTQERNKITFLSVFCVPVSRGFEARLRVSGSRRGYGEAPQSRLHASPAECHCRLMHCSKAEQNRCSLRKDRVDAGVTK